MRLVGWLSVFLAVFLFAPAVSAHYYVVLDENLSYLRPYAEEIAGLHNGSVVVSNFSNLSFLSVDDYALFIVDRTRFDGGFVYSTYRRLDFNGDGIYDPVIGFLPVWSADDLVRFYWALTDFKPGRAVFFRIGKVSYTDYLMLSKNASLIWLEGHGSPDGVDMGSWNLNPSDIGDVSGKVFVLESCDVGRVWETDNPLVMSLIGAGSPTVVASIDMGGVSYLPESFWASGYPIGKLVQISNAYFMKVGVKPKAVLFGDPALVPIDSSRYGLVRSPAKGIYSRIFPRVNGYIYTPGEPGLGAVFRAYGSIFSVIDLWRGLFTMGGIGFMVLLAAFGVVFGRIRPEKKSLLRALVSATASFLILGAVMYYPPFGVSIQMVMFWVAVALFMEKKVCWGLLALFLPPAIITLASLLLGTATPSYGAFLMLTTLLSSLAVLVALFVFSEFVERVSNL